MNADGRRELILYATPTGELARRCAEYFGAVTRHPGATTAQTYPPHCTLTGFFHRSHVRADDIVRRVAGELAGGRAVAPSGAVTVAGLRCATDWVGLELESDWLTDIAREVVVDEPVDPGDDPVRHKGWLHLSLAYGDLPPGVDGLGPYAELAVSMVDPAVPAGWVVALWERHPTGRWERHGP